MREKSGASKGVGFARIDDDKLCHTIIQELNGQPFPGTKKKEKTSWFSFSYETF